MSCLHIAALTHLLLHIFIVVCCILLFICVAAANDLFSHESASGIMCFTLNVTCFYSVCSNYVVYVLSRFCLSVSVSVTSRCYTKIANRRITLTMPNDKNTLSRCTTMFGDSSSAKTLLNS